MNHSRTDSVSHSVSHSRTNSVSHSVNHSRTDSVSHSLPDKEEDRDRDRDTPAVATLLWDKTRVNARFLISQTYVSFELSRKRVSYLTTDSNKQHFT